MDTPPEGKGEPRCAFSNLDMPERGALSYLIDWLDELGFVVMDATGLRAVSWQDINYWSLMTGTDITPWEAKSLVSLSQGYLIEHREALNPARIAPYMGKVDHAELARRRRARRGK